MLKLAVILLIHIEALAGRRATNDNTDIYVDLGANVNLPCKSLLKTQEFFNVQWWKDGIKIVEAEKNKLNWETRESNWKVDENIALVSENWMLSIRSVKLADEGRYQCIYNGHIENVSLIVVQGYSKINATHARNSNPATLKVAVIETRPFVFSQNDQFNGFSINLLHLISKIVGFEYELYLVAENEIGIQIQTTGEWSGLIRDVIDKQADLGIGPIAITSSRMSVVDFTTPFMNLGIGVLYKRLISSEHTFLAIPSYISPTRVFWCYVLVEFIIFTIIAYILARTCQYAEISNNKENDKMNVELNENNLITKSCTRNDILIKGFKLNSKARSTRIIIGVWWFFTLTILCFYMTNLTSLLSLNRTTAQKYHFENVEGLALQTQISYGVLNDSATLEFFRHSQLSTYSKMWLYMEENQHVIVDSIEEGVQRVIDDNYAFIVESPLLNYALEEYCNLTQVGELLDSKDYGIATHLDSIWTKKISLAILQLREKGIINGLMEKWWKQSVYECPHRNAVIAVKPIDSFGLIVWTLVIGLLAAIISAIFQFRINSESGAPNNLLNKIYSISANLLKCIIVYNMILMIWIIFK